MTKHATHATPHTRGSVIHWARAYDFLTRFVASGPKSARHKAVAAADFQPGERVLDVGCGPGVLTILAADRVGPTGEAHGIDPSPGMIKLARQKAMNARTSPAFRQAVIEDLPYPDATFDAVISSLMLHHLPDDVKGKGLAEIRRVLRPGGRLLAIDLNGRGIQGRLLSLVGHRLPGRYDDQLTTMMRAAAFAPELLDIGEKQHVTILARKPA
jgi:ubiquinone/menaquinone biosynthesis C-methylase UbiE